MSEAEGPPKTLVITGVDGFVGRHLAAAAAAAGWRVIGVSYSTTLPTELSSLLSGFHSADLRNHWPVDQPADAIVHLAGLAAVGPSFGQPQLYIEANSAMVTNMCEALVNRADQGRPMRVVAVSSGAVYAAPRADRPLDEESPTASTSPYVVSKLLVESQLAYYSARGLDAVIARPFNHVGPGQATGFLVPDLTAALRGRGPGQPLVAGDLSTARDYTDVRDVVEAYLLLAGAPSHQEFVYNIASGRSLSGKEVLERIVASMGVDDPEVQIDPSRLRAVDVPRITGSAQRLRAEFGWRPLIDIQRSIDDYVGSVS